MRRQPLRYEHGIAYEVCRVPARKNATVVAHLDGRATDEERKRRPSRRLTNASRGERDGTHRS